MFCFNVWFLFLPVSVGFRLCLCVSDCFRPSVPVCVCLRLRLFLSVFSCLLFSPISYPLLSCPVLSCPGCVCLSVCLSVLAPVSVFL